MEKMNPEQSQGQKTDRRQLPTQNWTGKSGENVGKKPILCFFLVCILYAKSAANSGWFRWCGGSVSNTLEKQLSNAFQRWEVGNCSGTISRE